MNVGDAMKIALAQMDISWCNKEKNKTKCIEFFKKAQNTKVDLVLFPEMTLTGFSMDVQCVAEEDSSTLNWFKEQAISFNLNIGFGYVKKEDNKGLNIFSIVSSDGIVISKYTKLHPFSFARETDYYTSGDEIVFTKINEFLTSTFICYDLRFPEIFQIASSKSELITIIANWPKIRRDHWITLLKARAIENQCYVAAVNRVGTGNGIEYVGDSMIIDPQGNILTTSYNNEELIVANINLEEVHKLRNSFKVKSDRRNDFYSSFLREI